MGAEDYFRLFIHGVRWAVLTYQTLLYGYIWIAIFIHVSKAHMEK